MDKTEFDVLCEGTSAEETRLLSKVLVEWCDGDERSFPVHLAMLTRAQWRAAATFPLLVSKAREQFAADFIEHRQEITHLVSGFEEAIANKLKAVETVVTTHDQNTRFTLAEMRSALANAESVGERIRATLEEGSRVWNQARADFEAERQKLEQTRKELEAHITRRDWIWFGLALGGVLAIGVALGMRIAR
jgi:hypothetical protein